MSGAQANPFDQFDKAPTARASAMAANPFDQFDAIKPATSSDAFANGSHPIVGPTAPSSPGLLSDLHALASDIPRRVGNGLIQTAAGIGSLPFAASHMIAQGLNQIPGVNIDTSADAPRPLPDYNDISNKLYSLTGSSEYAPSTEAGRLGQAAIGMAGAGAVGGLAGVAKAIGPGIGMAMGGDLGAGATSALQAGGRAALRGVAQVPSSLAAGAAGQAAQDYGPDNPYAKVGMGVLGSTLGGGLSASMLNEARTQIMSRPSGGLFGPSGATLDPESARLAGVLQDAGVKLSYRDVSGSPLVKRGADLLSRLGISSGDTYQTQIGALNKYLAGKTGATGDALTPDVLDANFARMSGEYNAIAKQTPDMSVNGPLGLRPDTSGAPAPTTSGPVDVRNSILGRQLNAVVNSAKLNNDVGVIPAIQGHADNILDTAASNNGMLTARQYLSLTDSNSDLATAIKGGGGIGHSAGQMRGILDDMLQANAPQDMVDRLQKVRTDYKNTMTLLPGLTGPDVPGGAKPSIGEIPPDRLLGLVKQGYGARSLATGNAGYVDDGEIGDVARASQRFLKRTPTSGSGENFLLGGGAMEALHDPHSLLYAIPAYAALKAGGAALNSTTLGARAISGSLAPDGFRFTSPSLFGARLPMSMAPPPPFSQDQP